MSLTREQFLKPAPILREEVDIPELGGSVFIHGMTAKERSSFERQFQTPSGRPNRVRQQQVRERLLVACCRDEGGAVLFSEEDIDAIGQQRGDIIERLVNVAQRLCGMTGDDVETLAKNSEEASGNN